MDLDSSIYHEFNDILADSTSRLGQYVKRSLNNANEQLNLQLMGIQDIVRHCLQPEDQLSQAHELARNWPHIVAFINSSATYIGTIRSLLSQGVLPTVTASSSSFQDSKNTDPYPVEHLLTRAIIRPSSNEFEANMTLSPPIKDILLEQANLLQEYLNSILKEPYYHDTQRILKKKKLRQKEEGIEEEEGMEGEDKNNENIDHDPYMNDDGYGIDNYQRDYQSDLLDGYEDTIDNYDDEGEEVDDDILDEREYDKNLRKNKAFAKKNMMDKSRDVNTYVTTTTDSKDIKGTDLTNEQQNYARFSEKLTDLENRLDNFNRTCRDFTQNVILYGDIEKNEAVYDIQQKYYIPIATQKENDVLYPDQDIFELQKLIEIMFTGSSSL